VVASWCLLLARSGLVEEKRGSERKRREIEEALLLGAGEVGGGEEEVGEKEKGD